MRNLLFLFTMLFAFSQSGFSQESIFPAASNPVLKKHFNPNAAHVLRVMAVDTASMPFVDDFSLNSDYPTDSLWLDRDVFVNNNYSESPVTIGIATFDGLDEFGDPYTPGSSQDAISDHLTSRPIMLQLLPGDTVAWLSFFYQPQGLGDIPELNDSLVLEFKDTGNVWHHMWAVPGRGDTAFKRVTILINDPVYLFNGFQFRFYNIATANGNRDHWNLDYVIVEYNSVTAINDFGFLHPQITLLNDYTAMPYPHYKEPGVAASVMKTTVNDTIRNFDYGPSSVAPYLSIIDSLGTTQTFSYPSLIVGLNLQQDTGYTIPLNGFIFDNTHAVDSMDFKVKSFSDSPFNQLKLNDSSFHTQHFYNYYAYDDGTAEAAYGLQGNVDIASAYQFDVKKQDTLLGVQIYFNPTGIDVSNKLFQLTVWSDINIGNNTDVQLYRMINCKPGPFDGINEFKTYLFDTLLIVNPGNIWIGMIQNEPQTLYGVGFDRNTDARSHMFYHIDTAWYQSSIPGSWMMRPLFGKHISGVGIDEVNNEGPAFSMYPNPANDMLLLSSTEQKKLRYEIINSVGALVMKGNVDGKKINLSAYARGFYMVRVMDEQNRFSVKKIILE
jgi:hypothetical protein